MYDNVPAQEYVKAFETSVKELTVEIMASWRARRTQTTLFYGYVTFVITIIFIMILPRWNRISNYIYSKFLQFNRHINLIPQSNTFFLRINPMSAQMIIFWTITLFSLVLIQSEYDIGFISARLGRIPVYCLPTVLFLTLRPSPLPDVLYLSLLPVHKWLSRIVILQSLLHTIASIYIMHIRGSLQKIGRKDNVYGLVAMAAFLIIMFTSLPSIRRKFFNFFYINHYVCTWIAAITLYFHVRPGIPYLTILNIAILLLQMYYKLTMTTITSIEKIKISDNMVVVQIPNPALKKSYNLPGCHIRLIDYNPKHSKLRNYLKLFAIPIQHPYTLASLPVDKKQKLVVRVGRYKLDDTKKYFITGAYLPHLSFIQELPKLNNSSTNQVGNLSSLLVKTKLKKCLIVVGGSAISFALPILRVLNYNGAMVKIIWVIRDHEDLKCLDYFQNYLINDDCIDIFITGNYTMAEKVNFKEALNDLHRRKMEMEIQQETEILSGGYSFQNSNYNTQTANNTVTPSNLKFESRAVEISEISSSSSDDHENIDEMTPLVAEEIDLTYASSSLLNPMQSKSKSCIELRNHHQNQPKNDSYQEETIDIELNESKIYKETLPTMPPNVLSQPSAGMGYSDIVEPESNETESKAPLPDLSNNFKFKRSMSKSFDPIRPKDRKTSINSVNPRLFKKADSINGSSALYDDLEDYWVLKSSFSRIEFGRPKLGLYYYSWCIGSSCSGPLVSLQTGESICYNLKDPKAIYTEQHNELYSNDIFMANRTARMNDKNGEVDDTIWVIGAGPAGLVDNVRLWANDCGFSFHEESFIV